MSETLSYTRQDIIVHEALATAESWLAALPDAGDDGALRHALKSYLDSVFVIEMPGRRSMRPYSRDALWACIRDGGIAIDRAGHRLTQLGAAENAARLLMRWAGVDDRIEAPITTAIRQMDQRGPAYDDGVPALEACERRMAALRRLGGEMMSHDLD